ncbi:hypothetical protein DL768_006068 [Monosporascus sp. mg162]|nr:hypothetical protein DL768_006068 [Monosporascus sp. mg162]
MDADLSTTFSIEVKTAISGDLDPPGAYKKDQWKHNIKSLSEALAREAWSSGLPIFGYPGGRRSWKNKLRQVFDVLREEPFGGKLSDTCSLRVHVPIFPGWSVSDVKGLTKAFMRYKPEFEALCTRFGRDREYLESLHATEDAVMWIDSANLFVRAAAASSHAEGPIRPVEFVSIQDLVSGVPDEGMHNVVDLLSER